MTSREQAAPLNFSALWSTSTFFFALFHTLLGSLPWLSILKNAFNLQMYGPPAALLREYDRLRDAALKPLLDLLSSLGMWVPTTLIDFLLIYFLVATAFIRGNAALRKVDMERYERDPQGTIEELRSAARAHGLTEKRVEAIVRRFRATRTPGWRSWFYYYFTTLVTSLRWPRVFYRNTKQIFLGKQGGAETGRTAMSIFGLFLFSAFLGCAFYLFLSRLSAS